jgi:antitoxin component of MazEF toxin-antitoxin module
MPGLHTRKLINLGGSKVVALPQEWLRWLELEYGPVREVIVQTDGVVIIRPKIERERQSINEAHQGGGL